MDDSELLFNNALGWYDVEKSAIEGIDMFGSHDTVPLARVQRIEMTTEPNATDTITLILFVLVLGILAVVKGIALTL